MRVLFLVGNLGSGGLERFVTRVAIRAHIGGEFEPVVCCLHERKGQFLSDLEAAGIRVFAAPSGWARHPIQTLHLSKLILMTRPDIVHSQVNFALVQQLLAVAFAGFPTFFITERNCYPLSSFARLRRALQFHLLKISGVEYSANANQVAHHLASMVWVSPNTIQVLPNSVPQAYTDSSLRQHIREILGWDASHIGIGYIARMAPHKGHEIFLKVLQQVHRANPQVRACLLGDGPQREQLEFLCRKLGLTEIVRFQGIVNNVDQYLQAFDMTALLSQREGMSNAILEAMAAGKAIIATNVGANAELLENGHAGVLIDDESFDDIISIFIQVVQDENYRVNLGHRASIRAEAQYNFELTFQRLIEYYSRKLR